MIYELINIKNVRLIDSPIGITTRIDYCLKSEADYRTISFNYPLNSFWSLPKIKGNATKKISIIAIAWKFVNIL